MHCIYALYNALYICTVYVLEGIEEFRTKFAFHKHLVLK